MVSHRSGETEDTFIADLVVGLSTGQVIILILITGYFGDILKSLRTFMSVA